MQLCMGPILSWHAAIIKPATRCHQMFFKKLVIVTPFNAFIFWRGLMSGMALVNVFRLTLES